MKIFRYIIGLTLFVLGVADLAWHLHAGDAFTAPGFFLDVSLIGTGAGILGVHVDLSENGPPPHG